MQAGVYTMSNYGACTTAVNPSSQTRICPRMARVVSLNLKPILAQPTYAFLDKARIFLPYLINRNGTGTNRIARPPSSDEAPGVPSRAYTEVERNERISTMRFR